MEKTHSSISSPTAEEEEEEEEDSMVQELLPTLEQEACWDGNNLFKYKGFWFQTMWLKPILRLENHFKPRDSDILLSTMPKSGTTWLKALTYSIANRSVHAPDQATHPLFASSPQELVHTLEISIYRWQKNPNLEQVPSPRIFATHLAHNVLPEVVVRDSACKFIYICRNPLDQFISERFFHLENNAFNDNCDGAKKTLSVQESFDKLCRGISPWGPTWEHALGYWKAHLKNPDRLLFLKYEDLKKDDKYWIRKIAEFIGLPFSPEEEENRLVEKISKLCSFDNLREANKQAGLIRYNFAKKSSLSQALVRNQIAKRSSFFRKGETGDWTNYLSKEMAQRMKDVMGSKLEGSGLVLDFPGL